jgi:thiamine-phosphate pyrophosphorylase
MPLLHTGLYAITDPHLMPGEHVFPAVEAALKGGCKVIQYRDKLASGAERENYARQLVALCSHFDAQLIINDDLELCLKSGAHGVHLGRSDGDIQQARHILGPDRILGVTCHSDLGYAQVCIEAGVDYCAFGRIFPSQTKPQAPHCSIETLEQACALLIPIVAIGGINLDNIGALMHTRIHCAAVIHGLFSSDEIEATARQFQAHFSHYQQV